MVFQKGHKPVCPFQKGHKLNSGKHHSEETKRKIGEKSRGRFFSKEARMKMSLAHRGSVPWNKGLVGWNVGKIVSNETRKKISNSLVGKRTGSESNTWKGGKKTYWRKFCLRRDKYTCRKCGNNDPRVLTVDHIKSKKIYPELSLVTENGMTLCANCHQIKSKEDEEYNKYMLEKYWKNNGGRKHG